MKNSRNKLLVAGAIAWSLCSVAVGQGTDTPVSDLPPEEIEEIVVYGQKSLLHLKKDIERTSNVVFDSFNALNDDDQFDIHCSDRVPAGSNIAVGSCRPNFEDDIYHEATQRGLDRTDGNVLSEGFTINNAAIEGKLKKKKEELDAKMEALARENPEFAKALIKLLVAERIFADERERRCAGRIICKKDAPE